MVEIIKPTNNNTRLEDNLFDKKTFLENDKKRIRKCLLGI